MIEKAMARRHRERNIEFIVTDGEIRELSVDKRNDDYKEAELDCDKLLSR